MKTPSVNQIINFIKTIPNVKWSLDDDCIRAQTKPRDELMCPLALYVYGKYNGLKIGNGQVSDFLTMYLDFDNIVVETLFEASDTSLEDCVAYEYNKNVIKARKQLEAVAIA